MNYAPQVSATHYRGKAYSSQERWDSYGHQLSLIAASGARSVLEVGPGSGTLTRELRARDYTVTTLDIAPDLHPDVLGSITQIPLPDSSVDLVVACEILEHIHFDDVPLALRELVRVARKGVVISVPHPGYVFSLRLKIPLLPLLSRMVKIPFFWKQHLFNGEHYWELGKRSYSVRRFLRYAQDAGLVLVESTEYPDDPAHRFFRFTV